MTSRIRIDAIKTQEDGYLVAIQDDPRPQHDEYITALADIIHHSATFLDVSTDELIAACQRKMAAHKYKTLFHKKG